MREIEIPILAIMGSQGKRENKAAVLGLSAARLYKLLTEQGIGTLRIPKAGEASKGLIEDLIFGKRPLT